MRRATSCARKKKKRYRSVRYGLTPPSQPFAGCWLWPICRSIKTQLPPTVAAVCVRSRRPATCLAVRKLYVPLAH